MIAEPVAAVDTVVVGGGMAGLTAARTLEGHGFSVVVLDKGRAVGGRMATRRFGGGRFDHGAQHFSARSDSFRDVVSAWRDAGIARVWFESESVTNPTRGIERRHAGVEGMRGIPEYLAGGLDVRTGHHVERIDRNGHATVSGDGWSVVGRSVIVTAPLPQSLVLLDRSGIELPVPIRDELDSIGYDPTLAVLAIIQPGADLDEGHAAYADEPIAWIADNQHKGISSVPALTIHSTSGFARARLDADVDAWTAELVAAAGERLGVDVTAARGHRWRYAQPQTTRDDGAVVASGAVPVVLAGEVFSGARVEGAFSSGWAAADLIADRLG